MLLALGAGANVMSCKTIPWTYVFNINLGLMRPL
jgi:hypothetical protein